MPSHLSRLVCESTLQLWYFTECCIYDHHAGDAYIPSQWKWSRPRLYRWSTALAKWAERMTWRLTQWADARYSRGRKWTPVEPNAQPASPHPREAPLAQNGATK